jgi:acylglycerol lipase
VDLADRLVPALPLSVHVGHALGVRPTDLPEVIEALRADPLVPEHVRVATVAGLFELMEAALKAAAEVSRPTLLLYGTRDDLIPVSAICDLVDRVVDTGAATFWQARIYPDGYHLLTRYTGAERVLEDIAAWLLEPAARAPARGLETLEDVQRGRCGSNVAKRAGRAH